MFVLQGIKCKKMKRTNLKMAKKMNEGGSDGLDGLIFSFHIQLIVEYLLDSFHV